MTEKPFVTAVRGHPAAEIAADVMRRCEAAGAMQDGEYRVRIDGVDDEPQLYTAAALILCLGTT